MSFYYTTLYVGVVDTTLKLDLLVILKDCVNSQTVADKKLSYCTGVVSTLHQ